MPENTKTLDHKAEALRLIDSAVARGKEGKKKPDPELFFLGAQVHASLAIAEGQERVAEALESANQDRRERRASAVAQLHELVKEAVDGVMSVGWDERATKVLALFEEADRA